MTDALTAQLRASSLNDATKAEEWKKSLNLPSRDARHQTEVRISPTRTGSPVDVTP